MEINHALASPRTLNNRADHPDDIHYDHYNHLHQEKSSKGGKSHFRHQATNL